MRKREKSVLIYGILVHFRVFFQGAAFCVFCKCKRKNYHNEKGGSVENSVLFIYGILVYFFIPMVQSIVCSVSVELK